MNICFSHGLLNITSTQNTCLLNCICASLYTDILKKNLGKKYAREKSKGENYLQFYSKINTENVNFPTGLDDIKTLERNNPVLRFHVWTLRGSDYYKTYETKVTSYHKKIEVKNVHTVLSFFRNKFSKKIDMHNNRAFTFAFKFSLTPSSLKIYSQLNSNHN